MNRLMTNPKKAHKFLLWTVLFLAVWVCIGGCTPVSGGLSLNEQAYLYQGTQTAVAANADSLYAQMSQTAVAIQYAQQTETAVSGETQATATQSAAQTATALNNAAMNMTAEADRDKGTSTAQVGNDQLTRSARLTNDELTGTAVVRVTEAFQNFQLTQAVQDSEIKGQNIRNIAEPFAWILSVFVVAGTTIYVIFAYIEPRRRGKWAAVYRDGMGDAPLRAEKTAWQDPDRDVRGVVQDVHDAPPTPKTPPPAPPSTALTVQGSGLEGMPEPEQAALLQILARFQQMGWTISPPGTTPTAQPTADLEIYRTWMRFRATRTNASSVSASMEEALYQIVASPNEIPAHLADPNILRQLDSDWSETDES